MRGRSFDLLLASSSVSALLIGGGTSPALALCANGAGSGSGFDNPALHTTACVAVTHTSFTGNITNEGTISPGGITFTNGTMTGVIASTGTILGGITIDSQSVITGASKVISIGGDTFTGGIRNSGNLSGAVFVNAATFSGGIVNSASGVISNGSLFFGIFVQSPVTFSGDISNAGSVSGFQAGIGVENVTSFLGRISNSGTITVLPGKSSTGIDVRVGSVFTGGITNSGTITGSALGLGIGVHDVSTFLGGISNSGYISAGSVNNKGGIGGIAIASVAMFGSTSAGGGITNGGVITLANTNFFVGTDIGISVRATSLFVGGVTNIGTITGGMIGIDIQGDVSTFSGGITNAGHIDGTRTGIVVGASSFISGHIVNSGTITSPIAINLTAAGNAITIEQNAGLIAGNILLSPHGDTLNVAGGTINGNVVGQNAGDTVNFALGAGSFTYASPYAMTGLAQVNFNSGTAYVDGAITATAIAVNNGGTLAGTGTLTGPVTVMSGGTLMPGQPLGTLNVAGHVTFNAGSTYAVQITPSANSATSITGAPGIATINGGTVTVTLQPGLYGAHQYVIMTTTGGVSGTFAGPSVGSPFTGSMRLDYSNPNDVLLDITPGNFLFATPPGAGHNQINVVNAVNNGLLAGNSLPPGFVTMANLSNSGQLNALSQLSGQNAAGFFQGAFQAGSSFLGLLLNPFVDGRFGAGGSVGPGIGFAPNEPPALPQAAAAFASAMPVKSPPPTFDQRFSAWGGAYGGSGNVRGDPVVGSSTTNASVAAFAAGIDYRASPDTTWGFALAGGGTNWSLDSALGGGRSDFFQAGLYGSQHWGNAYLSGALAYNFHDVTTNRTVTIAGTDMLTSRFQANGVGARLEGGYRYAMPWVGITPYAAAQVQSIALPSRGETATSGSNQFALNFASQTATTTRTELGAWLDHTTLLDRGASLTLYTKLAWAHDFGDTPSASAIFQSLPGSSFVVNGAAPARDGGLVTTGARYDLVNGWSFTAKFDGEFSQTTSIYSGTAMVRKMW